jgi:osmoprotectant transport system permease protein
MIAMNAAAELEGQSFARVAAGWLARTGTAHTQAAQAAPAQTGGRDGLVAKLFGPDLGTLTRQHLTLVLLSVGLACLAGIPLGVLAAFAPRLREPVLALAGVLQTVPSLALLAILIPLLGRIGAAPALAALFVYSLLPIVRNTCTGIGQVPAGLRTAALALGLRPRQRLLYVDLPLARPVILAGVKTAAVTSVGTATIAAFIGAGGYGERITVGLALNDNDMLLAGAIPAALLALVAQGMFEVAERLLARRRGS